MSFEVDAFGTIVIAVLVLLVGRLLVKKIRFLQNYNIPEPVVGGLIAAIGAYI
ncbi:sodium/glutamate symporter, partial [Acinetobacter stercoris]|uniref:sodium/glutamate symporter n=1 Tax=Acinetobacter stercoris TaxID=2126983 RepID=UPI001BC8972F